MRIGDSAGAVTILKISPFAWHHINFRGRYEFKSGEMLIDIQAIIRQLAQIQDFSELYRAASFPYSALSRDGAKNPLYGHRAAARCPSADGRQFCEEPEADGSKH